MIRTPSFPKAFADLMDLEGWGEVHNVEGDPGGLTVYGISYNAWPEAYKDGPPTEDQARQFYREQYWYSLGLDQLRSHRMAFEVFEFSVNSGDGEGEEMASRAAQAATNKLLWLMGHEFMTLTIDGVMGRRTRRAMNNVARSPKYVDGWVRQFNKHQLQYYESLPKNLQRRFLLGWSTMRT